MGSLSLLDFQTELESLSNMTCLCSGPCWGARIGLGTSRSAFWPNFFFCFCVLCFNFFLLLPLVPGEAQVHIVRLGRDPSSKEWVTIQPVLHDVASLYNALGVPTQNTVLGSSLAQAIGETTSEELPEAVVSDSFSLCFLLCSWLLPLAMLG